MRFTNAFAAACATRSLEVTVVTNEQFDSSKDTNVQDALTYAMETGADYIIYGYVTKWVDRPTSVTSERDFAGLSIFVRSVESGEVVFSSEMQAHGIRYSSHGSGISQLGLDYTGARLISFKAFQQRWQKNSWVCDPQVKQAHKKLIFRRTLRSLGSAFFSILSSSSLTSSFLILNLSSKVEIFFHSLGNCLTHYLWFCFLIIWISMSNF